MTTKAEYRETLLADLRARLQGVKEAAHRAIYEPTRYIVRNPRGLVCMRYQQDGDTYHTPRITGVIHATQFEDAALARRVAGQTFNGAHEPAQAVPLALALQDERGRLSELITALEEVTANSDQ